MPRITRPHHLELPPDLLTLLATLPALRASYVVGGSVRDSLLGRPVEDVDIEVYGQDYEVLCDQLGRVGRVDRVGRSFGVIKFTTRGGDIHDFSIPRRDSKTGPGHKGFMAASDPSLSLEEACARRDFTLNAILYDPRRKELLDFHGGLEDLAHRRLRHTSPAFAEDPLRVLRGMQFVSRFDLTPDPETIGLCRSISSSFPELARERVKDEWFKWACRSTRPSAGLRFLRDTEWIRHFPEVAALIGVEQDPEWHPEGDVFTHTLHCCDAMAGLDWWKEADETSRIIWMLAILAHDFAKPRTTRREMKHGRLCVVSPEHEALGGPVATAFLESLLAPTEVLTRVIPLVTNHLAHLHCATDRAIRRLAHRLQPETIHGLCAVMAADAMGRPPLPKAIPETILRLLHRSRELELGSSAPRPILLGRHLMELGVRPGPHMGRTLALAFEAQLDGAFADLDGAQAWLREQMRSGTDNGGTDRI